VPQIMHAPVSTRCGTIGDKNKGRRACAAKTRQQIVAYNAVSPQPTETDRDTFPAKRNYPHTLALLSSGDTVT